jgi:hypothetical protein
LSSIRKLMESPYSKISFLIISIIIIAVYSITLLSFNLTIQGTGFSPFTIWSPIQTIFFAIIGFLFLFFSLFIDDRERMFEPKWLIFLIPLVLLSFLIQFTADPLQLLNHISWLEVLYFLHDDSLFFTIVDFGALLLYGGLLGLLITYLLTMNNVIIESNNILEKAADFTFRIVNIVIFIPALLIFPFFYMIAFAMTLNPLAFPSYGEGTIGSILVVSILLSMYFGARLLNYWKNIHKPQLSMITSKYIIKLAIEIVTVYTCTTAAFSIMGGLITDSIPVPLLIPFDYILLSFCLALPFSLLLIRDRVFPFKVDIANQSIELDSPVQEISLS